MRRGTLLLLLTSLPCTGCGHNAPPTGPAPNDDQSASASLGAPWFEDIARVAGLDFVHVNGHQDVYLMPEIMVGGAAWLDLEGDGDLDVYLVQSGSLTQDISANPPNRLYRNNGDGSFTDVTDASGTGDRHYGMGTATGDYDNDGDVDLYVTNYGANVLYRNEGDGSFTDVTAASGTGSDKWSASAAFLDYDADGDLDLYVTNYVYWSPEVEIDCHLAIGHRDYCTPNAYCTPAHENLYRNNGDGSFTDVSTASGVREDKGNGLGVVCGDFNADGLVDIFVANDGMMNIYWVNQGDGTFRNRALFAGCAVGADGMAKAGMGVSVVDLDDDGDLDLLVVNLDSETDSFFRNFGEYFVEEAALSGLSSVSRGYTRFGVGFIDFDNDGSLDLYEANGRVEARDGPMTPGGDPYAEPNILVRGTAAGKFEAVLPQGGTSSELIHTSRAAAFADFDDDGGMDILVANLRGRPYLLRNVVQHRGRWIGLSVLEAHGSPAIGATVNFEAAGRNIVRNVRTGYSYLAANDPRIHVGLGEADGGATNLTVRWSDGAVERFEGEFALNQYHTIRRGSGTVAN